MLQAIRERVTGVVAIIVLGLLAIPFAFFGIESYFNTSPPNTVATVGGEEVTISDFQRSFNQYRNQMRQRLGENYDPTALEQPTVRRQHLEDMIDQELLRQYALDMGLGVSQSELAGVIRDIPQFQVAGRFDTEVYQRSLGASGLSVGEFERDLREDMLVRKIPVALSESGLATRHEVDRLLRLQKETRDIRYVSFPAEDFRDQVNVTEADIEDYYENNPDEFMTTERVAVEYIELDASELVADLDVDEETLRRRYEAVQSRYMTPEARRAAHILLEVSDERDEVATRELAGELAGRARSGEDFATLAEEYSDDPGSASDGGDLGWIEPDVMVEAFEETLFELEPGEISDPVKTGFGFHVMKLEEIREPRGQSFEEARAEILDEYRQDEGERMFIELTDRVIDLVYADPTSLGPIADELDLEIRRTDPFSRSGADEGLAGNQEVVDAAFSDLVLLEGSTSDPIELGSNRMVVIRAAEHFPAQRQALADVSNGIRERLERQQAFEMAEEAATALADAAHEEPARLAELADEHGLEITEREDVTRQDYDLGGSFISELFSLPVPGDRPGAHKLRRSDGWVVVVLDEVTPGDPAAAGQAERQRLVRQLESGYSGYELAGLIAHLRTEHEIRVFEDQLNRR